MLSKHAANRRARRLIDSQIVGLLAWLSTIFTVSAAMGAEPSNGKSEQQLRFFEGRIRPLLIEHCYECHAGGEREGGLRLDVATTISGGGDSGPSIIPGDPESSLLFAAIRREDLEMPPDEPLSERQIRDVESWIRAGAIWPITQSDTPLQDDQPWWAAEPIDPGPPLDPVPTVDSPTPIDRHLDWKLADHQLTRAPPADRRQLIRRLSFDLLGLPPTPAAVEAFVRDRSADAYERLVDRMFADPAYGERMARLWLDLVRFAESDGWRADAFRPQAWRYREFVIEAFNSKLPYDRFVALQLAGDEIAPESDQAIAAVGFLRLGIYEYNQRDAEGQWRDITDEMTDVTADVFLATGIACAKCHDHKFDPIPRADYYNLRSVFEPVLFVDRKIDNDPDQATRDKIRVLRDELAQVEGDSVANIHDATVDRFPLVAQQMYAKPATDRTSYEHQISYMIKRQVWDEGLSGTKLQGKIGKARFAEWIRIRKQLDALGADPYADADFMTVADTPGEIRPTRLPGTSHDRSFSPAVPTPFGGQSLDVTPPANSPTSSGRRSALAAWITSPQNPVAARVIVNRLWQYHFGIGIVSSPNDFGRLGELPSHPRLLDRLANRLMESQWNLQTVQREIVRSAAYRQSSVHPNAQQARQIDSGNRLVWHKAIRRLDAEQFRDALLVATDSMIDQVGGFSIEGTGARRSLYLRRFRNRADEMLSALDAPPGVVGTAKRDQTTTAPQALMLLNHPRMIGVASRLASRIEHDLNTNLDAFEMHPTESKAERFVRWTQLVLTGRPPEAGLVRLLSPLIEDGDTGPIDACHVLLNSNDFLYVD